MRDNTLLLKFPGKSWMDWFRGVLFGMFALITLGLAIAEMNGMRDALGRVRHDAIVPRLVMSPIFAVLSLMFTVQAVARSTPIIQLYREGTICRRVGIVQRFWLPSMLALALAVLSGNGFRQLRYRFPWQSLRGVTVFGVRMMYYLTVQGSGTDQHGEVITGLTFAQHEFGTPIDGIANAVNHAISSPQIRNQFPSWD
jgi:hypothetical protein